MAKKLIYNYRFDASAKTITMGGKYALRTFQLVTNVTDNIIIYNFADSAKGGSASYNSVLNETILTLSHNTTSMSDDDEIQIFVDLQENKVEFGETFTDPVSKLRVSTPENLIDTDFEYGLQPTKWETVELVNNIPSAYTRAPGVSIFGITQVLSTNNSEVINVEVSDEHGLSIGDPIEVRGLNSRTANGKYLITQIPTTTSFNYKATAIQSFTGNLRTAYTTIIPGSFFTGSSIEYDKFEGINTDAANPSTLTVKNDYAHGFSTNTSLYITNTVGKKELILSQTTNSTAPDSSPYVNPSDDSFYLPLHGLYNNQVVTLSAGTGGVIPTTATGAIEPTSSSVASAVYDAAKTVCNSFASTFKNDQDHSRILMNYTGSSTYYTYNDVTINPNASYGTNIQQEMRWGAAFAYPQFLNSQSNLLARYFYNPTSVGPTTLYTGTPVDIGQYMFRQYTQNGATSSNYPANLSNMGFYHVSTPYSYNQYTDYILEVHQIPNFDKLDEYRISQGGNSNYDARRYYELNYEFRYKEETLAGSRYVYEVSSPVTYNSTWEYTYAITYINAGSGEMSMYTIDVWLMNTAWTDYYSVNNQNIYNGGSSDLTANNRAYLGSRWHIQAVFGLDDGHQTTNGGRFRDSNQAATRAASIATGVADALTSIGLSNGDDVKIEVVNDNRIKIKTASDGTPYDITNNGTAPINFVTGQTFGIADDYYDITGVTTFTTSISANSRLSARTLEFANTDFVQDSDTSIYYINFPGGHGISDGQKVTYNKVSGADPHTGSGFFVSGTEYYAYTPNSEHVGLSTNESDFLSNVYVDILNEGTGSYNLQISSISGRVAAAGTVTTSSSSKVITGVDTKFTSAYSIGDTFILDPSSTYGEYVTATVASVVSDTSLSLENNAGITTDGVKHFVDTKMNVRADGTFIHRPFDGGVEITAGSSPDSKVIRQTRKYFRYQSGKGIQCSMAINFNPYRPARTLLGTPGNISNLKLTASDGATGDRFGYSVAVSDNKIVVGAPTDTIGVTTTGSAYIYNLDGTGETKITPNDGGALDYYGSSVGIVTDKIFIGSYRNDDPTTDTGSVYIYDLNGSFQYKLIGPSQTGDLVGYDYFGSSLATGNDKLVVGAYFDYFSNGNETTNFGAAYIYDATADASAIGIGSTYIKLTASDGSNSDFYGYSVAVGSTVGSNKIVVGAFGDDDNGGSSGSAYIYNLDGTGETKITASDGAAGDSFGFSVAVGNGKIVVGAPSDTDAAVGVTTTGSAYIYNLDGTGETKITASDSPTLSQFGYTVAIENNKIYVGSNHDDDNGSRSGSLYIYNLDGTGETKTTAFDGAAADQFGGSVAVGSNKIVVGANTDTIGVTTSGSVHIFDASDSSNAIITTEYPHGLTVGDNIKIKNAELKTLYTPTDASYDPDTGILTITISNHGFLVGEYVTIVENSFIFTCSYDNHATEHPYPRRTDPAGGLARLQITKVDTNTFEVNVGVSQDPNTGTHIFQSGTENTNAVTHIDTSNIYNGERVVSASDTFAFTFTTSGIVTSNTKTPGGFIEYTISNYTDAGIRGGLFDDQNGMFYEYDGSVLYAVRRSSTAQLAGTVQTTKNSNVINGTNTRFQDQLNEKDYIVVRGQSYKITRIVSDSILEIQPKYRGSSNAGIIITKTEDLKVPQHLWSIDPADGTGPSGYALDINSIQMVYMDYSWYGAGKIRFGFKDINGHVKYVHEFIHNNKLNEAYMRTGNVPARYEAFNIGEPTYIPGLFHWGTSVIMDGGFDDDDSYLFTGSGKTLSFTNGDADTSTANADGTLYDASRFGSQRAWYLRLSFPSTDASKFSNGIPLYTSNTGGLSGETVSFTDYSGSNFRVYIFLGTYGRNGPAVYPSVTNTTVVNIGAPSSGDTSVDLTTLIPLVSLRLAPSVDNNLIGSVGERDIINRMQLKLNELGISVSHDSRISVILNGALSNIAYSNVGSPSLSQYVAHDYGDTIQDGTAIYQFRASGGAIGSSGERTVASQAFDLSRLIDMGNSILGGDGVFPNGPDIITICSTVLDTSTVNKTSPYQVSSRISWAESQA